MEIHRIKIFGLTLLLAGLALYVAGLWLLLSPAQYRATARIKVLSDANDIIGLSGPARDPSVYDPYFIQAEIEVIQSEAVLRKVVEFLRLNSEWGEKYAGGNPLKTVESIKLLKHRVTAYVVPNTLYLIEIRATSEDSDEAAKIANAIAEAYMQYRVEVRRQLTLKGIELLTENYQREEEQIKTNQEQLEQLRKNLNHTNFESAKDLLKSNFPSYFLAKKEFDKMTNFHSLLKKKIETEKIDINLVQISYVKIVDPAIPPQMPEGPNRLLGAILLAMGLAMTAGEFFLTRFSRCQSA
jgi:uncharacterized protein involved in exopolysaccharide biosynthesis